MSEAKSISWFERRMAERVILTYILKGNDPYGVHISYRLLVRNNIMKRPCTRLTYYMAIWELLANGYIEDCVSYIGGQDCFLITNSGTDYLQYNVVYTTWHLVKWLFHKHRYVVITFISLGAVFGGLLSVIAMLLK